MTSYRLTQSRNLGVLVSGVVALVGLLGLFTEAPLTRRLGFLLLCSGALSGATTVMTTRVGNGELRSHLEKEARLYQRHLERQGRELEHSKADIERTTELNRSLETANRGIESELGVIRQQVNRFQEEATSHAVLYRQKQTELDRLTSDLQGARQALAARESRERELAATAERYQERTKQLLQQLKKRQLELQDLVTAFTERMRSQLSHHVNETLVAFLGEVTHKLEKTHAKNPQSPAIGPLTKLIDETSEKIEVYREIIAGIEPDQANPLNDIDEFADIFGQIHRESAALRVRYRNTRNIEERLRLKSSVDRRYAVDQLETLAKEHDKFRLSYQECMAEMDKLLESLESCQMESAELRQQLQQRYTVSPVQWNPATRDELRMGNTIITYYAKQGIWLDRGYASNEGWQAHLTFHIDRNDPPKLIKDLNEHAEPLQDLTHALTPVQFKRLEDSGLVQCAIQLAPKPKRESTREEIDRLWRTAKEFPTLAAHWTRIRITGGSESGKSPTAENVAVCLLQSHPGSAKLYNPQHNSQKNYWSIPTVGTSHGDSVKGIRALAELVKARSEGAPREQFQISIFDEIDSTLSSAKSAAKVADDVKYIIKQASHQNLGAIFIGQNANVSTYHGMDRSDWNSAVALHIGENAFDAIENSNQFKGETAKRLVETAEKLNAFCETKNKVLGLGKTDPKSYRFGFVVEPGRKPYFIELPEFGQYPYVEAAQPVASTGTQNLPQNSLKCIQDEGSHDEHISEHKGRYAGGSTISTSPQICCPSCGSDSIRKHSTNKTTGDVRWRCLNQNCDRKTFTEGQ